MSTRHEAVAFAQIVQRDHTSFPTARDERDRESLCVAEGLVDTEIPDISFLNSGMTNLKNFLTQS